MSLWDKRKESGIENVNHDQQDDAQEVESRSTAESTQLEDSADHVNVLTDYGKTDATTYREALVKSFELYTFQDFKEMSKMDKLLYGLGL